MEALNLDDFPEGSVQEPAKAVESRPGHQAALVFRCGYETWVIRGNGNYLVDAVFLEQGNLRSAILAEEIQRLASELMNSPKDINQFIEEFICGIVAEEKNEEFIPFINAAQQAANIYGLPLNIAIGIAAIHIWSQKSHCVSKQTATSRAAH